MDSPLNVISFFIEWLGEDLVASFNAAYDVNELTVSYRRGVIPLIPKEESSVLELSHSRPMTLVNVDCKVVAKVIANE